MSRQHSPPCKECSKYIPNRMSHGYCRNCYEQLRRKTDPTYNHKVRNYNKLSMRKRRTKKEIRLKQYQTNRKCRINNRNKALLMVGRGVIRCGNCGSDDRRLLQINHINGGGTKERWNNRRSERGSTTFVQEIVNRKRGINDLEIRCGVCNWLHFYELKYGALPYEIKWEPDQPPPPPTQNTASTP